MELLVLAALLGVAGYTIAKTGGIQTHNVFSVVGKGSYVYRVVTNNPTSMLADFVAAGFAPSVLPVAISDDAMVQQGSLIYSGLATSIDEDLPSGGKIVEFQKVA